MKKDTIQFTEEPADRPGFRERFDREYTRYASIYNMPVKVLPFWKTWLKKALPHITGDRILELSFGTGYLMTRFAGRFNTHGADYNMKMIRVTRSNLIKKRINAALVRADVQALPYRDGSFDCIVSTMAFSGYPDGRSAMSEIHRVLRRGGKLIIIDFNYPADHNRAGIMITRFMERSGDIIRDMDSLLNEFMFSVHKSEIGGFGSVHLYIAFK